LLTGFSINFIQLTGYSVVITPIIFGMILKLSDCNKQAWWHVRTALYYFSWFCVLPIILGLPVILNILGWSTLLISCSLVYWMYRIGWVKTRNSWTQTSTYVRCIILSICAVVITGLVLILYLNKPTYPTDTYSLIYTSYSWLDFILFFILTGSVMYIGIKNKRYSIIGGLIALTIFGCWSIPFSLPSFWVLFIFLCTICITDPIKNVDFKVLFLGKPVPYMGLVAAMTTLVLWYITYA